MYTVPLDIESTSTEQFCSQTSSTGIYPIKLDNLIASQQNELRKMILMTSIHIHTSTVHVGIVYGAFPGEAMTALDAVMVFQQLSQRALDRNIFVPLPANVVINVKAAFVHRVGLNAAAIWDDFMAGRSFSNGPVGRDLLLGATEVWGAENVSFGEYSVIHLD
ncbi:hypothetical protein AN958_07399 [Leucoagaricus sp. SymC.cos]|nr:hypothetical protein AN958_07399 [Leucoagaricus sp. SymC.cos]